MTCESTLIKRVHSMTLGLPEALAGSAVGLWRRFYALRSRENGGKMKEFRHNCHLIAHMDVSGEEPKLTKIGLYSSRYVTQNLRDEILMEITRVGDDLSFGNAHERMLEMLRRGSFTAYNKCMSKFIQPLLDEDAKNKAEVEAWNAGEREPLVVPD